MGVTIETNCRPLGQNGPINSSKLGSKLRSQINIDQSAHSIAAKETPSSLQAPDDARIYHSSGLDLLIRPDLDIGLDNCAILNEGIIANHRAFKHHCLTLNIR